MRAVTVGERNPEPEVPPVTEFTVVGHVPPPFVLMAAIFYKVQGINSVVFVITVYSCRKSNVTLYLNKYR